MKPSNPFVGLRPFLSGESHLFFGRRGQINDVLTKLQQHRLLAVVGRSGCGKSSLVRAGLIPALAAGFLVDDREQWRICVTQPGSSPLRNLATALWDSDLTRDLSCDELTRRVDRLFGRLQAAGARAVFEHLSPKSHTTDGLALGDDENLLILVDQFEELFRFGLRAPDDASRDEAARFVTILLALAERRTAPVYVVITMRSDYLRDCDAFYGLPEAINRSLYLVPRLTREMRREIIEGASVLVRCVDHAEARRTAPRGQRRRMPLRRHRGRAGPVARPAACADADLGSLATIHRGHRRIAHLQRRGPADRRDRL